MKPELQHVKAVQDNDGRWYVIPAIMGFSFYMDLQDEDVVESGQFSKRWGRYKTDGDLNSVELWAQI